MEGQAGQDGFEEKVWGVSMDFLLDWMSRYSSQSTAKICEAVMRRTKEADCAFIELLARDPETAQDVGEATLYLCHSIDARFYDTIRTVQEHFRDQSNVEMDKTFVWIDILCVNQHERLACADDPVAADQSLEETNRIIQAIGQTFIAIPNWDNLNPENGLSLLNRSWCVFEIASSRPEKATIALKTEDRRSFLKQLEDDSVSILDCISASRCLRSSAWIPVEKDRIRKAFSKWRYANLNGFEAVDHAVIATFGRWVAEESWSIILSKQKDIEREFPDPFQAPTMAENSGNKRQSLRSRLRHQALFLQQATETLRSHGFPEYAIQICKAMLEEHSQFQAQKNYAEILAANLCHYGAILEDSGQFETAITQYQAALDLARKVAPDFLDSALHGLGICKWQIGNCEEALDHFTEVAEVDRKVMEAQPSSEIRRILKNSLEVLGLHKYEIGDHEGAIATLSEAIKLAVKLYKEDYSAETVLALRNLADIFMAQKRYQEAASHYEDLLKLLNLCDRDESNQLVINIDEVDDLDGVAENKGDGFPLEEAGDKDEKSVILGMKDKISVAQTLRSLAVCKREIQGAGRDLALSEAASLCMAALDLDRRKGVALNDSVLNDLKLLITIESERGKTGITEKLEFHLSVMQRKLHQRKMARGPFEELKEKYHLKFEQELPCLLGEIQEKKNYIEISARLEELSYFYEERGVLPKGLAYRGEAAKWRLHALEGPFAKDAQKQRLIADLVKDDLVHIFRLFRVAGRDEKLLPHCLNFVKMVKFFYRNDPKSDNPVLALELYGRLLYGAGYRREAKSILEEASSLAEKVYESEPNDVWLGVLEQRALVSKALQHNKEAVALYDEVCNMHLDLGLRNEKLASMYYQLAMSRINLADRLRNLSEQQRIRGMAEGDLQKGINILCDGNRNGDGAEDNIAIMRRELAQLFADRENFRAAAAEMQRVIEVHAVLYDEDEEEEQAIMAKDMEVLQFNLDQEATEIQAKKKVSVTDLSLEPTALAGTETLNGTRSDFVCEEKPRNDEKQLKDQEPYFIKKEDGEMEAGEAAQRKPAIIEPEPPHIEPESGQLATPQEHVPSQSPRSQTRTFCCSIF